MFALPIFTGSDASAASGGMSELSEWQRSADEEAAPSATKMPYHRNRIFALDCCYAVLVMRRFFDALSLAKP